MWNVDKLVWGNLITHTIIVLYTAHDQCSGALYMNTQDQPKDSLRIPTFICAVRLPHITLSTFYSILSSYYYNKKINEFYFLIFFIGLLCE